MQRSPVYFETGLVGSVDIVGKGSILLLILRRRLWYSARVSLFWGSEISIVLDNNERENVHGP